MYQLVDFINPDGVIAFTEKIDKINTNLEKVIILKKQIEEAKINKKSSVSFMTVLGRWIVIYRLDLTKESESIMHFIDFRIEANFLIENKIFPVSILTKIETLQKQYDSIFKPEMDTVELSYAEPFEEIIKPNFFICTKDAIVLAKAKALNTLSAIENLNDSDSLKVVLADEKIQDGNISLLHIYALINWGNHRKEANENGFAYLKIYDLKNNFTLIEDLQKAIEELGSPFDRAFLIERFTPEKLN